MTDNNSQQSILVVGDNLDNLFLLRKILMVHYNIQVCTRGIEALEITWNKNPPSLILMDAVMSEINGFEVCRLLRKRASSHHIPVIFVSSLDESFDEAKCFEAGGVDYITKPFQSSTVLARVRTHLALRDQSRALEKKVVARTHSLVKRTQDLNATQDVTIYAMATLAEYRDNETGAHIRRTQRYVWVLATHLMGTRHTPDDPIKI